MRIYNSIRTAVSVSGLKDGHGRSSEQVTRHSLTANSFSVKAARFIISKASVSRIQNSTRHRCIILTWPKNACSYFCPNGLVINSFFDFLSVTSQRQGPIGEGPSHARVAYI